MNIYFFKFCLSFHGFHEEFRKEIGFTNNRCNVFLIIIRVVNENGLHPALTFNVVVQGQTEAIWRKEIKDNHWTIVTDRERRRKNLIIKEHICENQINLLLVFYKQKK